jgi:hypothetical protein
VEEELVKSEPVLSLKQMGVERVYYIVEVSVDKVDLDAFRAYFESNFPSKASESHAEVSVAPRDGVAGPYHATFAWSISTDSATFVIDYFPTPKSHESDERPPFADDLMAWLGQFFRYDDAQSHIHASFVFPVASRQSKLLSLPLKTDVAGDAEINGISVRLPSKPAGVSSIRLLLHQKRGEWGVELVANRRVAFKSFSLNDDVSLLAGALNAVLEEKKP